MGEAYDESVDVYSFGMLLLAMMVDGDILDFIGERYRIAFGKKKAPKQPSKGFHLPITPRNHSLKLIPS